LPPLDGDEAELPPPFADELPKLPPEEGAAEELSGDELGLLDEIEQGPDAGWLEDAESDDELEVGDLGEEIVAPTEERWAGEEPGSEAGEAGDLDDDPLPVVGSDAGEEGPEGELLDEFEEAPPLDAEVLDDDALPEGFEGAWLEEPGGAMLPAFALDEPRAAAYVRLVADGVVLAAAAVSGRVVLGGDGVYATTGSALEPLDGRTVVARRIATPGEDLLTSLVFVGPRALVAVSARGRVLRSEDEGKRWDEVATLGGEDAGHVAVDLVGDAGGRAPRLWARAHGGGLFRSDDRGEHWEGPVLPQPVRALATDGQGGVVAVSSGWAPQLLHASDGHEWRAASFALPAVPTLVAARGEVWALAFAHGAGLVSTDGGRTAVAWPLLAGASALALVETDDGAVHLLAAIQDDLGDHATLLAAAIDREGAPRGARRVADLDPLLPAAVEEPGEENDARVEELVPLDTMGRRVLVVTPRGLLVVGRDAD
jgi:hypothetical protein